MATRSSKPRIVSGPAADPRRYVLRAVAAVLVAAASAALLTRWYTLDEQGRDAARVARLERDHLTHTQRLEALGQQLAVARRSAQITEAANDRLRAEVEELQEEIAALKADNEFYQRLLGSSGETEGLAVHDLLLTATPSSQVFRYRMTLTQNLQKARLVAGEYSLTVDGLRGDQAVRLNATDLGLRPDDVGAQFEFKYFQQLGGTLALPLDFVPDRLTVSLLPQGIGRKVVTRDFEWRALVGDEAVAAGSR